jgi:DegV family protein with EDD domain
LGLGFQALTAAEAAAEASTDALRAAATAADSTRARLRVSAALDTLEYARRSGRIQGMLSAFGGLLHVKPLIDLTAGEIKRAGFARTTSQATDRLAAFFESGKAIERLAILHTGAEGRARSFLERLMGEHHRMLPRDILLVNVTTVIGTHVGPKALGFAAVTA